MEIVIFNDKRSAKCRHMAKITETNERYSYLLNGVVTAKPWIDLTTLREFFRPQLNGISVADNSKELRRFRTPKAAIREGNRLRIAIIKHLQLRLK